MIEQNQFKELLYQALETEIGGIQVYKTALRCAVNDELKEEWKEYLEQTQNHERILRDVFDKLGLDAERMSPGRQVVHHVGMSLVRAMEMALAAGNRAAAQLVAAECVVEAETKDHLNWELIGECAKKLKGEQRAILKEAHEQVEDEEASTSTTRPDGLESCGSESLGMPAVLPPPEEEKEVKTAIGAARAKKARSEML